MRVYHVSDLEAGNASSSVGYRASGQMSYDTKRGTNRLGNYADSSGNE